LARVVGREQPVVAEAVPSAMGEPRPRPRRRVRGREQGDARGEGQRAEGDEDPRTPHRSEIALEVPAGGPALLWKRAAVPPGAAADSGEKRSGERESIAPVDRGRLIRQADGVERAKEKRTRFVSGEDPARAIAAMSRRRQADDQEARLAFTEGGN